MKNPIPSFVFALYTLGAVTAEASQLVPIEASKLQDLAEVVLVGTVNAIERDAENTIPKYLTDYDIVTVEVAFVLKGTVASNEVKIRLATRGNKAFDPALTKQTTATFFLKKAKDGFLITAYPGSVAVFPGRFDKAPTKVADQIGTLVERLSKSHTWNNGAFPKLDTPKDASAKDVIAAYCKMSSFQDGSRISEFTALEERTVKISGPLPDAYIAARCKTDHGPMIFLLQYQEKPGQWWVKQYDAPAEQDAGQLTTPKMFAHIGEWTQSPDKALSIRMSSDKAGYQLGETVKLRIELRNDSTQPAELSSLEDESYPWIEGPGQKRIGYIGPQIQRPPKTRVTLEPGMSVTREVAVEGENWGKLETPGKHTATFSYGRPQSGAYKGLTSTLTFDVN